MWYFAGGNASGNIRNSGSTIMRHVPSRSRKTLRTPASTPGAPRSASSGAGVGSMSRKGLQNERGSFRSVMTHRTSTVTWSSHVAVHDRWARRKGPSDDDGDHALALVIQSARGMESIASPLRIGATLTMPRRRVPRRRVLWSAALKLFAREPIRTCGNVAPLSSSHAYRRFSLSPCAPAPRRLLSVQPRGAVQLQVVSAKAEVMRAAASVVAGEGGVAGRGVAAVRSRAVRTAHERGGGL